VIALLMGDHAVAVALLNCGPTPGATARLPSRLESASSSYGGGSPIPRRSQGPIVIDAGMMRLDCGPTWRRVCDQNACARTRVRFQRPRLDPASGGLERSLPGARSRSAGSRRRRRSVHLVSSGRVGARRDRRGRRRGVRGRHFRRGGRGPAHVSGQRNLIMPAPITKCSP